MGNGSTTHHPRHKQKNRPTPLYVEHLVTREREKLLTEREENPPSTPLSLAAAACHKPQCCCYPDCGEREEVRECIIKYPHTHSLTHSPLSNTPHHTLPLLLQRDQRGVGLEGIAHRTRPIIPNVVVIKTLRREKRLESASTNTQTLAPLQHTTPLPPSLTPIWSAWCWS